MSFNGGASRSTVVESDMKGTLYVVATPIGNLTDITQRAIDVLRCVDLIAAEDTRNTRKLLNRYHIPTKCVSYWEHNERAQARRLIGKLSEGYAVGLVSDAGTPTVSDPGFHLVRLALDHGIRVVPVPGASSISAALSVSGVNGARFIFLGFLPRKRGEQRKQLEAIKTLPYPVILFESKTRIRNTLATLHVCLGDRRVVVCRELTKVNETVISNRLSAFLDGHADITERGEFVIVVDGAQLGPLPTATDVSTKDLIKQLARREGVDRQDLYRVVHRLKHGEV